jgi:hypothetical protein
VGIVEAQVTTPQDSDGDEPPLPDHDTEVMASHEGLPTVAEQNQTHGAASPQPDHGIPDDEKYGGGAAL